MWYGYIYYKYVYICSIWYGFDKFVNVSDGFANPMAVEKSMNYIQMGWVCVCEGWVDFEV